MRPPCQHGQFLVNSAGDTQESQEAPTQLSPVKILSFEKTDDTEVLPAGLLHGWQGLSYSSHCCCLPGSTLARSQNWKPGSETEARSSDVAQGED